LSVIHSNGNINSKVDIPQLDSIAITTRSPAVCLPQVPPHL